MVKRVLSLCDFSGNMIKPWLVAGFECWIVDPKHPSGIHQDGNLVRVGSLAEHFLPPMGEYAVAFSFAPCTDLANSGNRHKQAKGLLRFAEAVGLFAWCLQICEWTGAPYLAENPVGSLSGLQPYFRKPDHIFDPCNYGGYLTPPGDAYTKKTCLWTGNGFVMPEPRAVEPINVCSQGSWVQTLGGKSERTKELRSMTPKGFAQAVFEANYNKDLL
jgi:hypothetical protein